jgi:RNA polymerase sigma-70 factor (ECF subfamily)
VADAASDDRALLERAKQHDPEAFEALVERHKDKVYAVALHMLHSESDAAEVTQETFLSAWKALPNFRGDSEVSTWLHRISGNFALMRLRKKKARDKIEEPESGPAFSDRGSLAELVADWHPNAEGNVLDAELRRAIEQATAALPESHRQVFLLRDVDGLSYEEITEITGESLAAVKSRLHRARLALRAAIDLFYAERQT